MKQLIIIVFLFIGLSLQAQDNFFNGYAVVGFNASQYDGDGVGGFRKLGGNFGFGTLINASEKFKAGLEIIYSMKGSRRSGDILLSGFRTWNLDFVDIPVYGVYQVVNDKYPGTFGINVGVIPNILIRFRIKDVFGGETTGIPGSYRRVTLEGFGGVSYIYKQYGIDFRYAFSLIDLDKNRYSRNHYMSVRGLYYFGKKG